MHFILFYDFVPDYLERRVEYRDAHMAWAQKAVDSGELFLAGALANPADQGILVFQGESSEVAERFAKDDPYVKSGIVTGWHVREWSTVVGIDATNPIVK